MPKKAAKKSTSSPSESTTEIRGLIFFAFALLSLLSLISFSLHGHHLRNWLGAAGYVLGWSLTALLGLSSYLFILYSGWIGWRLIFKKPLNHLPAKTLYVLLGLLSVSMLLSVIEDQFPTLTSWMNATLYQDAWEHKIRYHLGGAPVFYFYRDLPIYNLVNIFNALGVTILFSSTLLASLLLLAKVSPFHLIQCVYAYLKSLSWRQPKVAVEAPAPIKPEVTSFKGSAKPFKGAIEETQTSEDTDSDFLRYVKLRIPGMGNSPSSTSTTPAAHQQEMLQIEPEMNL